MKLLRSICMLIAIMIIFSFTLTNSFAAPASTTLNNAIKYKGAELKDPIDGMWQGFKTNNDNGGALESNQDGIEGDGTKLTLKGYNAGANAQYAYVDMNELHNKMIRFKLEFDGEFYDPEASFITFVFRSAAFSSKIFWDESCYTLLLKGGKVEANKYPATYQGVNNQLGGSKGNIPLLKKLETPFTPGTYELEVGALDGTSPKTNKASVNLVMKINGKEVINVWDDSERTPIIKRKGYFMVALCATQKDNGSPDSRSSVTIYPIEDEKAATATTTSATDAQETGDKATNAAAGTEATSTTGTEKAAAEATPIPETTSTPVATTEATEAAATPAPTESLASSTQAEQVSATEATAAPEQAVDNTNTVSSGPNVLMIISIIVVIVLLGVGALVYIRRKR